MTTAVDGGSIPPISTIRSLSRTVESAETRGSWGLNEQHLWGPWRRWRVVIGARQSGFPCGHPISDGSGFPTPQRVLLIGLILGGGLSIVAAILAVIALLKGLARGGKGIGPVVFAAIFIVLTWGGISVGGGIVW